MPDPRRRRSPLALASVVLAVVWLFGLGSVAAIALGYAVKRRIDAGEAPPRDRTLALAGIGLGLAGLAIAVVFFATQAAPG